MISQGLLKEVQQNNQIGRMIAWQSISLTMNGKRFFSQSRNEQFKVKATGDLRCKQEKPKVSVIAPKFGSDMSPDDKTRTGLYNVLVKLRLQLSQTRNVAPYMIVTEQTLLQLAQMRPTNAENLAKIVGFNTTKVKSFGSDFIDAIAKYSAAENIETDKFDVDDGGLPVNETTLTTYKMFQTGKTPAEIGAARGLAASTIVGHLATCLEKGGQVDITCQGLEVSSRMIADVAELIHKSLIKSDVSKLGPIKEELMKQDREDVDWPKLRLIVAKLKCDVGVTDDGILKWNDDLANEYISEKRNDIKNDIVPKTNTDSGKEILTNLTNTIADESTKTNPKIEAASNVSSGNIAVVPPLVRSDSSKRKRELPEWMSCSSGRKEMALKKMKSNSLFK